MVDSKLIGDSRDFWQFQLERVSRMGPYPALIMSESLVSTVNHATRLGPTRHCANSWPGNHPAAAGQRGKWRPTRHGLILPGIEEMRAMPLARSLAVLTRRASIGQIKRLDVAFVATPTGASLESDEWQSFQGLSQPISNDRHFLPNIIRPHIESFQR